MAFDDLTWVDRDGSLGNVARVFFQNGYGASVIDGPLFYTRDNTYELAVLRGDRERWSLTYRTPITNDVLGYQTKEEITVALQAIEALPPAKEE